MQRHRLSAVGIKRAGDGKHADGAGLYLIKTGATGKWVYRYTHLGRRRDMGLGPWPPLGLAEARSARDRWEAVRAAGDDPLDVRQAERDAEKARRDAHKLTFAQVVAEVFDELKSALRGEGTRGKWMSPLTNHMLPAIGHKPVSQLRRADYVAALKPIWRTQHPTAIKALNRTRIVIKAARFKDYDCDPFEVDAAERMLGQFHHIEHRIPATPWQEIPDLYARLDHSMPGECLRWMILTLARTEACIGARKDEIDGDVWTIPAARMKGTQNTARDFRVPLSVPAQQLVERHRQLPGPFLFPSLRAGRSISKGALQRLLRGMNERGRPHGTRTSFRTWVQDRDACSWEVAETALAHITGNRVQRAYARSDLLERRRIAMEAWAAHVIGAPTNILRMHG